MNKFVADTMAIVLRLENRRMPDKIRNIFDQCEKGIVQIFVPTIALAEIGYLAEKNKIETNIIELENYCTKNKKIEIFEMTMNSVKEAFRITDIPELHDRLIAGVALEHKLPLMTNDSVIIHSKFVETIWK